MTPGFTPRGPAAARPLAVRGAAALCAALMFGTLGAAPAQAEPIGTWLRESGESRVRFARCGDALCGTVAWLKDPANSKSKIGQRVFFDMKPDGANSWSGSAFNPEDGKTYSGKMTLAGNRLTTSGCVFGGMICRSVNWTRAN